MPTNSLPLYRLDECPELMADGLVCDEQNSLLFLSLWGRDTAIQAFLARLTLGRNEQGLEQFHIVTDQGASIPVFVGNTERLHKCSSRHYRRTLFGSLVNLWLFDKRSIKPDQANARALAMLPRDAENSTGRLWHLVQETCPLPLLDHWRDSVLELLQSRNMLVRLPWAFGPLVGYQLNMDVPVLTRELGDLIRCGALGTTQYELCTGTALRHVA
ncbi:hypothetical protein JBO49_15895 [Serratia fonticola]|uniref:hypothetical protein n=1 Tax=Serratia fonticola TaxID=47917 RepID=UPI00192C5054|nr:hypothetical protein [Serratia fonticola]MBL5862099.1 hypothetical protein [Serratia fonticola]